MEVFTITTACLQNAQVRIRIPIKDVRLTYHPHRALSIRRRLPLFTRCRATHDPPTSLTVIFIGMYLVAGTPSSSFGPRAPQLRSTPSTHAVPVAPNRRSGGRPSRERNCKCRDVREYLSKGDEGSTRPYVLRPPLPRLRCLLRMRGGSPSHSALQDG